MKKCNSCNTEVKKTEFYKRTASVDGLAAICKQCQKDYDKARLRQPSRMKARRDYQKAVKGSLAHSRACKQWISKNPIKRGVHVMTGNAIRNGLLNKEPCEVCGNDKVHAHHDDYAKPMSVNWLCDIHHNEWHRDNGEGLNAD